MIPLILSALRFWKQDEELCADALGALRALVLDNPDSENQVVEHFEDVSAAIQFHVMNDRQSFQIGDRVMAKWKDGKEKGFRDEYPATVVGLQRQQPSGIGKYLLSNSSSSSLSSSSSNSTYHLCYDDSYEDKRVAYYNIRAQSEDEQKRHVQPSSHKETCEKNKKSQRKEKIRRSKETGKLICPRAHKLVRHVQTPSTYTSGSVLCDVCGKNDLVRSCTYFSHCSHCKYDLCDKCSETVSNVYPCSSIEFEKRVATKHRFFKWVALLFNAISNSSVKEKGSSIMEALSVGAARASGRGHPASRIFSHSSDFQKNLELIVQQGRLFLRRRSQDSTTKNMGRIMFPLLAGSTNKMSEKLREMKQELNTVSFSSSSSSKTNQEKTYTQNRLFRKTCSVVGSFGPRHFRGEEEPRMQERDLSSRSFFTFTKQRQSYDKYEQSNITTKHENNTLETLLVDTDEPSKKWNLLAAMKTLLAIQYSRSCVWNMFCCEERKKEANVVKKEDVKSLLKLSLRRNGLNDVNNNVDSVFDLPIDFFRDDSLTRMIAESLNERTRRFLDMFDLNEILRVCADDLRNETTRVTAENKNAGVSDRDAVLSPSLETVYCILSSLSRTDRFSKLAKSESMQYLLASLRDAFMVGKGNPRLVHFAIRIVRSMLNGSLEIFRLVKKSLRLDSHLFEKIVTEIERLEMRTNSKLHSRYSQDLFDTLVLLRREQDEEKERKVTVKKSKKIKPVMRCTRGHRLEFCPLASNVCDVCRSNGVRKSGTAYRCAGGCDYDVCEDCWEKVENSKENQEEEEDSSSGVFESLKKSQFEPFTKMLKNRKNVLHVSRTLVCPILTRMEGVYDDVTNMLCYPSSSNCTNSSNNNTMNLDRVIKTLRDSRNRKARKYSAKLLNALLRAWRHVDMKACENVETKKQLCAINGAMKSRRDSLLSLVMDMLEEKDDDETVKEDHSRNTTALKHKPRFRRNDSVLIRFNESMLSENKSTKLKDIAVKLAADMRRRIRPRPPAAALAQLQEFGVPLNAAIRSLQHTNNNPTAAINWYYNNSSRPGLNDPVPEPPSIEFLELALRRFGGDPSRAVEWAVANANRMADLLKQDKEKSKEDPKEDEKEEKSELVEARVMSVSRPSCAKIVQVQGDDISEFAKKLLLQKYTPEKNEIEAPIFVGTSVCVRVDGQLVHGVVTKKRLNVEQVDESGFDGQWSKGRIDDDALIWNSGSCDHVTRGPDYVEIMWEGRKCRGRLSQNGDRLLWSDNDVWYRIKETDLSRYDVSIDGGETMTMLNRSRLSYEYDAVRELRCIDEDGEEFMFSSSSSSAARFVSCQDEKKVIRGGNDGKWYKEGDVETDVSFRVPLGPGCWSGM